MRAAAVAVELDPEDTREIPICPSPEYLGASAYVSRHLDHESRRLDRMPTMEIQIEWWVPMAATL